jgi:hypothetical protein
LFDRPKPSVGCSANGRRKRISEKSADAICTYSRNPNSNTAFLVDRTFRITVLTRNSNGSNLLSAERGVSVCFISMSVNPVRGKYQLRASNGDIQSETSISSCKHILTVTCAGRWSYKFLLHFAWSETRMIHSVEKAAG